MTSAAVRALDRHPAGWLLVVHLNDVDRAAHANSTEKLARALDVVGETLAVLAQKLRADNWTNTMLVVASPYDTGEFEQASSAFVAGPFHSTRHPGLLKAAFRDGVVPCPGGALAPQDVVSLFGGLGAPSTQPNSTLSVMAYAAQAVVHAIPQPRTTRSMSTETIILFVVFGVVVVLLIGCLLCCIYRFVRRNRLLHKNARRNSWDSQPPQPPFAATHHHNYGDRRGYRPSSNRL
jgi:hypothetical protein